MLHLLLAATLAHADIGPAPTCPEGTYSTYNQGRRCVKNGYHLEEGSNGLVEVADAPPAEPVPTEPTPATPTPAAEPAPVAPVAPVEESGGCSTVPQPGSAALGLGALALLLGRRRAR